MVRIYNPTIDNLDFNFTYQKKETESMREYFSTISTVKRENIWRVALWKYSRVIGIEEGDEILDDLSNIIIQPHLTIESHQSSKIIENLVKCQGIGFPLASAILKFCRDDVFPIIDVRAYRALTGNKLQQYQYSLSLYLDYAKKLHDISKQINFPLREIDEQLYSFDKKFNGKI